MSICMEKHSWHAVLQLVLGYPFSKLVSHSRDFKDHNCCRWQDLVILMTVRFSLEMVEPSIRFISAGALLVKSFLLNLNDMTHHFYAI